MPSQSQPQTLLARLQPVQGAAERSKKRVKKEPSLLDRLQTSSQGPDPASSSAFDGTQSLLESLGRTRIEEKSELSRMKEGQAALSERTAKSFASPATLSIRGAARKSGNLSNVEVGGGKPRSTPSIRRPSLLERTFPIPANQVQTTESPMPPKPQPFRERLSAPSLKERLHMPEHAETAGDEGSSSRRTWGGRR